MSYRIDGCLWGDSDLPELEERLGARFGAGGWRVQETEVSLGSVESALRAAGPGMLRVPGLGWVGIIGCRGNTLRVLGRDLRVQQLPLGVVGERALREALVELDAEIAPALALLPAGQRAACQAVLRRMRAGDAGVLRLRLVRGAELGLFGELRVGKPLGALLAVEAALGGVGLIAGASFGIGALAGRLDAGWLWAWTLALLSLALLRALAVRFAGQLALGVGAWLKVRAERGALGGRTPLGLGVGGALERVLEAGQVEHLALEGAFVVLVAGVDLLLGLVVLARLWVQQGGNFAASLLALQVVAGGFVVVLLGVQLARRMRWTEARGQITRELVANLLGGRTRLGQQRPEQWHLREDQLAEASLAAGVAVDGARVWMDAVFPRVLGGALLFLLGMGAARGVPALSLGWGVGGSLLCVGAWVGLLRGGTSLGQAAIAAKNLWPLLRAPGPDFGGRAWKPAGMLLAGQGIRFGWEGRVVLRNLNLEIATGDRVLLTGESGAGKSTLLGVLSGTLRPQRGLLLFGGLDRASLGPRGWRVAVAPQFGENHIFSGTLAWNLLMGRAWPPTEADLEAARDLCVDLGLGPLLARMPSGLQQLVGEGGWQLSHGERSRVQLARALLQDVDLVLLDESFGALDPENLAMALEAARRRARSLVVVAHP